MKTLVSRPAGLIEGSSGFCPGCNHGILFRIIAELLDEMELLRETIAVLPIGCATLGYRYITTDRVVAAHGRASAVATGVKRCRPDRFVYAYQGDGDLAAIGLAETIHAANRGECFTEIFYNNSIYGMTGGQMAPTTLVGQRSTTGGRARDPELTGYPLDMCRLIGDLPAPVMIARVALNSPANIRRAKELIRKAFLYQRQQRGYCFIEVLGNCPTNWKMTPAQTQKFVAETSTAAYPLGVFRDRGAE